MELTEPRRRVAPNVIEQVSEEPWPWRICRCDGHGWLRYGRCVSVIPIRCGVRRGSSGRVSWSRRRSCRRGSYVLRSLDLSDYNSKLLQRCTQRAVGQEANERPTASCTNRMQAKPAGARTASDVRPSASIARVTCYCGMSHGIMDGIFMHTPTKETASIRV